MPFVVRSAGVDNKVSKSILPSGRLARWSAVFAVLFFSTWFMGSYYGEVLESPNQVMFGASGDQLKNYYTAAYHLKHGDEVIENESMMYPYGEHFFYTDEHPGLMTTLMTAKSVGIDASDHTVGIINVLMLLSLPLSALVIYLLLRELGVKRLVAVVGGLSIMMLSPQTWRMAAHFSLSYSFFIPLTWYLCIKVTRAERRRWWLVALSMTNITALFTHAYLGLMVSGFTLVFLLTSCWQGKAEWKSRRFWLPAVVGGVFPLVLVRFFLLVTDHHGQRDGFPYGILDSHSSGLELISPYGGFVKENIVSQFPDMYIKWEAWCYLGVVTVLALLAGLILLPFSRKREIMVATRVDDRRMWRIGLLAALPMLIFSLGLPMQIWNGSAEWLGFIKQFRSVGRFAWPFYFVATTFAFILINELYVRIKGQDHRWMRLVAACTMVLGLGWVYLHESHTMHEKLADLITRDENVFVRENLDDEFEQMVALADREDYQAIVPLPIFLIGNEHYTKWPVKPLVKASMVTSYHTGTPIMSGFLSHTGLVETRNIDQVSSPNWFPRDIGEDITDERPFLIIHLKDSLGAVQGEIMSRAEHLDDIGKFSFYSITKEALLKNELRPKDQERVGMTMLHEENFDSKGNTEGMQGKGLTGLKKEVQELLRFRIPDSLIGRSFEVTLWFHNVEDRAVNHGFQVVVSQELDGWQAGSVAKNVHGESWGYDEWALLEIPFQISPQASGELVVKTHSLGPKYGGEFLVDQVKVWLVPESLDTIGKGGSENRAGIKPTPDHVE